MPGHPALTALVGFDGKLPSRGDFVRSGLPRSFLAPWTAWVEAALSTSQAALDSAWAAAWLQAPLWCFALPGGAAGPDAALGMLLPSVDRAGRYYPLTLAAVFPGQAGAPGRRDGLAWQIQADALARHALAKDWPPDALRTQLAAIPAPVCSEDGAEDAARWWTQGNPTLVPCERSFDGMPPPEAFAGMLG